MLRPLSAILLCSFLACGTSDQAPAAEKTSDAVAAPTVVHTEEVITDGEPVTFADLTIDGMSCEMMCGGSIKKSLAALAGVSATEIKFDAATEGGDHAVVTYDPAQVSEEQLVQAVQSLHGGAYKVVGVAVTKQVVSTTTTTTTTTAVGNTKGPMEAFSDRDMNRGMSGLAGLLERLLRS